MDIKALQLASRFALPPNSLGYCGENTAPEKFKKCAIYGTCDGVEEEISKFIVLYPYLKTLSQITKLPVCSHKVIEAYWFGNDELKRVKPKHYNILLENFKKQGVPSWLIDELTKKVPKKFIPTHLFQILHVGVGRASGSVPYNLISINNCMIRWGKVEKVKGGKIEVNINSLTTSSRSAGWRSGDLGSRLLRSNTRNDDGGFETYKLVLKQEVLPFSQKFIGTVKVGDTVSIHWNHAVKILTKGEERKLSLWTKIVLDSFRLTGKAQLPKS